MHKLLIIDDEAPMRRLLRINLEDHYKVLDTGDPQLALEAVLQSKPNVILLDLRMPNYSGFELCRTFKSITTTQMIPIVIVSGEAGASTKSYCEELGATAYFEKPIDFQALRDRLEKILEAAHPERRSEVRITLRVMLNLRGTDANRIPFEELSGTENVSRSTFFCSCKTTLETGFEVAVSRLTGGMKFLGMARVMRCENVGTLARYAFRFIKNDVDWILQ